jgi:hypothetical protein
MNDAEKPNKKMKGGVKFFMFILLLYALLFFIDYDIAKQVWINFLEMATKIIPLLVFVFVVMVITDLIFTRERITKHLGEGSGVKGWFYAVVGGVLISGPPYVLYPMLQQMKEKGLSNPLLAVFLYNRNVKIAFLPTLIYYFGFGYSVVLSFYIILFSIFNGLLIKCFVKQE